jgi:hypothetical protein
MKYQITQPWPVRDRLLEVGTVIDTISGTNDASRLVREQRAVPPPNCVALNGPTFDALLKIYPAHQVRRLR